MSTQQAAPSPGRANLAVATLFPPYKQLSWHTCTWNDTLP
jgi:hypothetical protein